MFEVRIVGKNGNAIPTMEDHTNLNFSNPIPPGTLVLSDYCFDQNTTWLKPTQILKEEEVVAVTYNKKGNIKSMVLFGENITDGEFMRKCLSLISKHSITTLYPSEQGGNLVLFYPPIYIKKKIKEWTA